MKFLQLFSLVIAGLAFSLSSLSAATQLSPEAGADEILAAIEAELGTNCENVNTRRIVQAVMALARANPDRVGDIVAVAVGCKPEAAVALVYETSRVFPDQAADIAGKAALNNPGAAGAIARAAATAAPSQAPSIRNAVASAVPTLNSSVLDSAINQGAEQGSSSLPVAIPELNDLEFDSDSNNPSPSGL
ncbi:MAG: hypothetical protein JJT96_17670 [Opitutales bacterium]|nr:hypothetical protein [Opitutales bacterium]